MAYKSSPNASFAETQEIMMKTQFLSLFLLIVSYSSYAQKDNLKASIERDDLSTFNGLYTNNDQIQELFIESVKSKSVKIAASLLSKGANVSEFDDNGKTPLLLAATNQDLPMVQLLLLKGADPNQHEKEGLKGTPLMYACTNSGNAISKLLIQRGANVNAVDINNDPAINWATYYGDIQNMKLLIESGADLSISSKHGTSVDVGLRLWHADSVLEVFRTTMFNKQIDTKTTALLFAIKSGNAKNVAAALRKGASADAVDGLGTPLLQIAAESGNIEIVKMLLAKGADSNQLNRVGQSPLAFAARFNHADVVRQLLDTGADPNLAGEKYSLTPLMGAAVGGDALVGRILLDAGAKINETDVVNQCSALHWSMFYENTSFGELLLERGADYKSKVLDDRYTGYTLAEAYQNQPLMSMMRFLDSESQPLVGSWKINQIHYIYADTTVSVDSVHQGRLIITPNRYHIIYNPWIVDRTPFKILSKPTDDEIKHAFQTLVFNTGTYEVIDSVFTTTADIAKVPGFEGGKQYYTISLFGDHLELIMKDETYPNGKKPEWYQKLEILFKLTRED